jgi:HTH-type transcriptional regulator/antitoxin HipB
MEYPLKAADQLRPQLQALRRRHALTQAQLGEALGVTQARIVEIEANPGVVNLQQIMQVLNALGAELVIRETDRRPETDSKAPQRARRGRW